MINRIHKATLFPSLFMLIFSILLWFTLFLIDFSLKSHFLILVSSLFVSGLILLTHWLYSNVFSRKFHESDNNLLSRILSLSRVIGFFMLFLGIVTLIWIFHLIWKDIAVWSKDLGSIFFGSRVGEFIGLGIGMKVIHYFLIGLATALVGLVMIFSYRFHSCPYYFGYLRTTFQKKPIPNQCFNCSKRKECIMINDSPKITK